MKSVLILGAFSDMSYAIACDYAAMGYRIWLAGRNTEKLEILEKDLNIRFNTEVKGFYFDARDFKSHQGFYQNLPGTPEVTYCVFGYLGDQSDAEKSWDEAHKIIETNYTGAASILNIVAWDYSQKGEGTIVGISSVAGLRGRQSNYLYGSAKSAFTTFLSGLRNRYYSKGVHVLTVLPGFVATKMTEELDLPKILTTTPEKVSKKLIRSVKRKRNTVYIGWYWRYIMWIIRMIPEGIFKKLKL